MPGLCDVTPEDEVTRNPLGKFFGSAAHRSDLICLQTHANFLQPHHRRNFVLQPFHNLPWRSCRSAPQHPAHRALHRAGADPLQELLARLISLGGFMLVTSISSGMPRDRPIIEATSSPLCEWPSRTCSAVSNYQDLLRALRSFGFGAPLSRSGQRLQADRREFADSIQRLAGGRACRNSPRA